MSRLSITKAQRTERAQDIHELAVQIERALRATSHWGDVPPTTLEEARFHSRRLTAWLEELVFCSRALEPRSRRAA